MSRDKELRDLAIVQALSGSEDLKSPGVQIEDNYLRREREENRREQGFWVLNRVVPRTDLERAIWKTDKDMERHYLERWQKEQDEKVAHLQVEYDEDRMPIQVSKRVIKI
jgi:hypothetical protein